MSFEQLHHSFGVGDGRSTACVNSLAYLIYAEQHGTSREDALANLTDFVDCICPVIRLLSIRINDRQSYWPDHAEATKWMHETAPRLLGTKASIGVVRKRAFLCADAAVREIAPVWFDLAAEKWPEAKEWAEKLRTCDPVIDAKSARYARKVAQGAQNAASAADAAYASAAAAAAAAYASAAAACAASAYAYVDASHATAYAARATADASKVIKPIMLALLDRLIACNDASP